MNPNFFKTTFTNLAGFLFLLSSALSCGEKPKTRKDKPNIIVFLIDDMGVMDTSVPFLTDDKGQPKTYPLNAFYKTPNMEILARQGIRFETFYAHSVCSPSRTSIMTGQNAARHGRNQLDQCREQ